MIFWKWLTVDDLRFVSEGWHGAWMLLAKFGKWELVLMRTDRRKGEDFVRRRSNAERQAAS